MARARTEIPPVRPDGLQLEERRRFQEIYWTVERVAWIAFVLVVLAALLGLTGSGGVVSRGTAQMAGAQIDYPRIARWDSILRGTAIYIALLVIVRLSGRRTMAQMRPFDFVLLLIVAETTQQALLGDDYSISNAVILIVTLFTIDIVMSFVKEQWSGLGRMLDGVPTVLVVHGTADEHALVRSRVHIGDVLEAARRQHGLERLEQIKFAVLEAGGHISIIPKS